MALKFCPKCGNELEPDASFCDACGAKLTERKDTASTVTVSESSKSPTLKSESVIYAPFLKRLIAIILDSIIIGLIGSTFTWLLVNPWYRINFFDPIGVWWVTYPIDWLLGFLYHWGLEAYNNGQTLGKMLFNIRTVDENTLGQATSGNYAINNLFKGSGFLILDFLIGIFKNSGDPKKRIRIMQNVSETVVVMTN
jgi:uncharacterized RDD family membrane protein YckC